MGRLPPHSGGEGGAASARSTSGAACAASVLSKVGRSFAPGRQPAWSNVGCEVFNPKRAAVWAQAAGAHERDEEQDDEDHHLHEEVEAVVVEDVGVRVVRVVDPAEEDLE
eukprot:6368090-Prymnesium_polylepis.1